MSSIVNKSSKVLIITLLGIGVIELMLQLYNPFSNLRGDKILLKANHNHVLYNANPALPNQWNLHSNSIGFRGPDWPINPSDHYKAFIVGGTQAFSISSGEEHLWSNLLYQQIKDTLPNIWLNNAAVKSISSVGAKVLLEDHILDYNPEMVIFYLGYDDMLFMGSEEYGFGTTTKQVKYILYQSKIFRLFMEVYRYYESRSYHDFHDMSIDFVAAGKYELGSDSLNILLSKHDTSIKKFKSRLEYFASTCSSQNIQPVFVTHPQMFGPYVDERLGIDMSECKLEYMELGGFQVSSDYYISLLEKYNEAIRTVGKDKNIPVIDLAVEMPQDSKYYFDNILFSIEGQRKVANIMYHSLTPILNQRQ